MDRYLARFETELATRGFRGTLAPHALGRRTDRTGGGAEISHPALGIRAGRRRVGDCAVRQPRRPAQRDLVRHGRHHRQGVPGRGRPHRGRLDDGGGAGAPLQTRLRPADQGAGDRHDRDRRRRRLDRRHRRSGPAARRAALGRRRSRSRMLRPRRQRADRHRRQPGARLLRPGASSSAAAWRSTAGPRSSGGRPDRRDDRPLCRGGRLRHPQGGHREHGGGRAHPSGREGQGPAPLRHGRLRRRRSGARRRRRAHSRRARGDRPAGLGRSLLPRLPRRAAELRAGALAPDPHRGGLRRGGDQPHPRRAGSGRPRVAG